MIYKEKEKNGFDQRLKRYPVEQQIKIKKRRRIILIVLSSVLCLSVIFVLFFPYFVLASAYIKEDIEAHFISRAQLEKAEIYLNPSCNYFVSKANEIKGTDTEIYKIYFNISYSDCPVTVSIYDDKKNLLNKLDIDIPEDICSAVKKAAPGDESVVVYENEIQFHYWNEMRGGYTLCRSLNKFPPNAGLKEGVYIYIKDGWWNFSSWNSLWHILF